MVVFCTIQYSTVPCTVGVEQIDGKGSSLTGDPKGFGWKLLSDMFESMEALITAESHSFFSFEHPIPANSKSRNLLGRLFLDGI